MILLEKRRLRPLFSLQKFCSVRCRFCHSGLYWFLVIYEKGEAAMKLRQPLRETLQEKYRYRLILQGILVGLIAGLVTVAYRFALTYSEKICRFVFGWAQSPWQIVVLFAGLLALGVCVGLLTKKEPMIKGSGIPQVEGQLTGYFELPWWKILYKKFLGGCLAILGGLSLGREGPSILLGANCGQGISQTFHRNRTEEKYLITCGACAGLAAAFNASLAGVLFALEEVHKNFNPKVLLSAMSSAVTADVVSKLFVGMHSTFSAAPVQVMPISYYLSLLAFGALLGLFGAFYNRILLFSQTLYGKIHWSEPVKMMIPFAFAGLFGLTLPQVLGGGHSMIEALLHGEYALGLVAVLLAAKFVFSMISYGSGAPGGIFFPLLVLGALGGALFGRLAILCGVVPETYAVNFMLLGMAGMFTAIVRAPLTGIILIVEMSGSLTQLLSLSVVCLCAYIAADLCHSAPIYESLLDRIKPARYQAAHPEERIFLDLTVQFGSFVCRKKIEQVHWPKDCLITNIVRGRETLIPHGDTVILPGDMLTILCKSEDEVPLRRKLSKSLEN